MNSDFVRDEGDRFLIDEINKGSTDAFRLLVDRFSGRLKAFASKQLQGSGIDPEDAVQETFLSLVRNRDKLHQIRSMQAYLFTIIRRRIADLARLRGPYRGSVPLNTGESSSGFIPQSSEETPSTHARRDEAVEVLHAVLANVFEQFLTGLKENRKFRDLKILELIFSKGAGNKETARLIGTSEPTVSRTIKHSVERLQHFVERHKQADALQDLSYGDDVAELIHETWEEHLFTCLKRSTLGSYALGVLEEDWMDYVRFHLEITGCEYCAAHLADISGSEKNLSESTRQDIFTSSVGFLK